LYEFIKEIEFDRMGVFTYSHEEGTESFRMDDSIPEVVKDERANILMALQRDISLKKNRDKVGTEIRVLIDRKEGDHFVGRTEMDSPEVDNEVLINTKNKLNIGDFYTVRIQSATDYDLEAEL